jgi:hypothetical protein
MYVAFQQVDTSRGMIRGGNPAALTARCHAGSALIVELMIANDNLRS